MVKHESAIISLAIITKLFEKKFNKLLHVEGFEKKLPNR
jgi:hypothetical protein